MDQFFQSYEAASKISIIFLCFVGAVIAFKFLIIDRREMRSKYRELVDKYDAEYILSVFPSSRSDIPGLKCIVNSYMIVTDRKIIFISDAAPDYQLNINIEHLKYWSFGASKYRFFLYFDLDQKLRKAECSMARTYSFCKYAMKQNNFFDFLKANYPPPPKVEKNL